MKLVAAKCPNCGANIDVDKDSDTTKCEYCKSKIIVEDAIKKIKVELSGEVEISNFANFDKLLILGNRNYEDGDYEQALKYYQRALELEPENSLIILRTGICQSLLFPFEKFSTTVLINAYKNCLKNENGNINKNSVIKETKNAIDNLINNLKSFYKNNDLDSKQVKELSNNYIKSLEAYEFIYNELEASDPFKDSILLEIINTIDLSLTKLKFVSVNKATGNSVMSNYILPFDIYDYLKKKKKKYNKIYFDSHIEEKNKIEELNLRKMNRTINTVQLLVTIIYWVIGIFISSFYDYIVYGFYFPAIVTMVSFFVTGFIYIPFWKKFLPKTEIFNAIYYFILMLSILLPFILLTLNIDCFLLY